MRHLIAVFEHMSLRMACGLAGLSRSAFRRPLKSEAATDPDADLRAWLRDWVAAHPRRGYRNDYHESRAEGWGASHKKVQRLWKDEGLRIPVRRRRKRVAASTSPQIRADAPNTVWAVDFQFDADELGRAIKIAFIVDDHIKECIGDLVERSITADALTTELVRIVAQRGLPLVIR